MKPVQELLAAMSTAEIQELAQAVETGWIAPSSPPTALLQYAGSSAPDLSDWLRKLEDTKFTPSQIGILLRAIADGRHHEQALIPDLIISGPDVTGVPTADTHTVVQTMFNNATEEVVVAGYAFYNGKVLFERLAQRLTAKPTLKVIFHVDLPRKHGDSSTDESIVMRYAVEFRKHHWPWEALPEVYYDPRALSTDSTKRASLHAKIVVVDRRDLLVTSANFTEAAHQKNIEMGLLSHVPHVAQQVTGYFEGLRQSSQLVRLPLQ